MRNWPEEFNALPKAVRVIGDVMSWNYRIVHTLHDDEHEYGIHEAYGRLPHSITEDAVGATGETLAELRESYRMMAEAFDAPILESADFKMKETP